MSRLSVDVVTEVVVGHDEDGDVGEGAHVRELVQFVLDEAIVDATPEQNLKYKNRRGLDSNVPIGPHKVPSAGKCFCL